MDEKLKQAIDDLVNKFHIGDMVYDIRERVVGDGSDFWKDPNANSWNHPDVIRYSECVEILKKVIK